MRFPLALTLKIAGHVLGHKLRGTSKFATVLQLEPLHTCNLTCTGCGRIREYSTSLKDLMPLEDCLSAAEECDAPMISICGGEPLIYPEIEALVDGLRDQGRIVYLCTNGLFMRKKMRDYLAAEYVKDGRRVETLLQRLLAEQLVSVKEAEAVRQGPKDPDKPVISPSQWVYWNVHLDGTERTHDLIVEREGVFKECIAAIRMAKILGYPVATNTTVYKETRMDELERMFDYLSSLDVDGHTISPGYDYDAAKEDMRKRLNLQPENFFLTRKATVEKFSEITRWGKKYRLLGTPVYFEFLAGLRELTCAAWAIPTRNIRGWKAPCYVMTDGHLPSYQALLDETDWSRYGVENGEAKDPRCANCMMHCGYEPAAMLGLNARRGDTLKNMIFNFGARPAPVSGGEKALVFDGVSAGNGHRTGTGEAVAA